MGRCQRQHVVGISILRVQEQGPPRRFGRALDGSLPIGAKPVDRLAEQHARHADMGIGEIAVEFDRAPEAGQSLAGFLGAELVEMPRPTQAKIPRRHVVGRLASSKLAFTLSQRRLDRRSHALGHLVLDCEDVGKVAIVPVGP